MYKALLIGCGNIGALYDFDNNKVLTHAKAYSQHSFFKLHVYDTDQTLANKIASKYNASLIDNINSFDFSTFDCISICSPTETHFLFLEQSIKAGVKVIICEKPISYNQSEIEDLKKKYSSSDSKIIVNYIRRFQPCYIELKDFIKKLLSEDFLSNISIRYQRGFINNCSHAFDLLQFLFDKEIIPKGSPGENFENVNKSNIVSDSFDKDPTLSLQAVWNKINFNVLGLSNVNFSFFEIDIFFKYHRISITDAGEKINIYNTYQNETKNQPLHIQKKFSKENCLKNYMENVINFAYKLLKNEHCDDNFLDAANTNQNMLNILKN